MSRKTQLIAVFAAVSALFPLASLRADILPVANADFEMIGPSQYPPNIYAVPSWTFFGDFPATAGIISPGNAFGFNNPTAILYLGVDFDGVGFSDHGGVYQDLGLTTPGRVYTFSGTLFGESMWPSGYKISLRDAATDAELAAITDADLNLPPGSALAASFHYTETAQRALRLQIETSGAVGSDFALRAGVDNVGVHETPEPSALAVLSAGGICLFGFIRRKRRAG